jgi:hypothetical protein
MIELIRFLALLGSPGWKMARKIFTDLVVWLIIMEIMLSPVEMGGAW